jgi:hypothetical protein
VSLLEAAEPKPCKRGPYENAISSPQPKSNNDPKETANSNVDDENRKHKKIFSE